MLIQEEQLSVNDEKCALSTGLLPPGGLPRNSVVRINDRPDMTSAVYCGCKALNQTKTNLLETIHIWSISTLVVGGDFGFYIRSLIRIAGLDVRIKASFKNLKQRFIHYLMS